MCTVLLPLGDNPIAVNKYIKYWTIYRYSPSIHLEGQWKNVKNIGHYNQFSDIYFIQLILTKFIP